MPAPTDYLIPPDVHRTERLLLRSWMPGDGPAMSAAVSSSYDHLKTFMPWAKPEQGVEESERLARQFRGRWLLSQEFVIALFSPDEDRVLGGCGFHLRHGPLEQGVAEIGMWITAEAAGQGLGTHALETLIDWGFSQWPWQRLVWKCDTQNLASRRCAEKAGLLLEGVTRGDALKRGGSGSEPERRDTAWYAALRTG
jgi:RimJ/RimL family protein N-acetyltransferase